MKRKLVIPVVFVALLAACATSVPIKSVRLPTIDTSGVERLAIKPFENASGAGGTVPAQLTQYLTTKAQQTIQGSGKFTMVSAADPNADGIFTGRITSLVINNTNEPVQRKDRQGNITTTTRYKREVILAFEYSVLSTRTGMPIGTVSKRGTQNTSVEGNASGLTDALVLARQIVDSQMRDLNQNIVPTIVSSNRNLMNETSKDKVVKARMKEAMALVKNGNYVVAIERFDAIAAENGSVAAQVNASILREAIASDSSSRAELERLFSEKGGPVEKAINDALGVLYANVPNGETVTIVKTRSTERDRLDYVVDQMTKNITESGRLIMVDRSNQALINAEQQFQLSGNVSDDSIVSIGHQLGIHYMALCWVSGQMSLRRLNIRILNVETTQIISQSDFEI